MLHEPFWLRASAAVRTWDHARHKSDLPPIFWPFISTMARTASACLAKLTKA